MNDPRCSTCGNPIGMTLKEAVARRDGIMPFVVQHEALKAKFQKLEGDLKARTNQIAESEAQLHLRKIEQDRSEESLAREKAATAELLNEAEEAVGKFVQAQQEISSLREQIATAADKHTAYVEQNDARIESLRQDIEAEQEKRAEAFAGEADARAELATLATSNRETGKERDKAVASHLRVERDLECLKGTANSLKEQLREAKAEKTTSEKSAASLESAKDKLNAKIQRLEENIEKLRSTKPTASQRKLARDLTSLQTEHAKTSEHLQSAWNLVATKTREITELRSVKAASERRCRSLETDINEIRTGNGKLTDANHNKAKIIKKLRSDLKTIQKKSQLAAPSFSFTERDLLDAFSQEVSELFLPPTEIVTLGSGPLDGDDFHCYLETLGITPWEYGCPWIIVGREGWAKEKLNELLDDADFDEVRVFSQELFIAGILTTHDPFSLPTEILMKFAEGHPALEYLINSRFEWPEIVIEEDYGLPVYFRGTYGGVDESPLILKGYHAGVTCGLSKQERRDFLESAYKEEIDYVGDDDYMEEWGCPNHSKRLWRIAHHLRHEADKRKKTWSMRYAVRDWADDSRWLKKTFYTRRMRFTWPDF